MDQEYDQVGMKNNIPKINENSVIHKKNDDNTVNYDNCSAIIIPTITKNQDSTIKFNIK